MASHILPLKFLQGGYTVKKVNLFLVLVSLLAFAECSFADRFGGLFKKGDSSDSSFIWLLGAAALASNQTPGQVPGYDPSNPDTSISRYVVASEGGTLYLNNELQLTIPPGSLTEDTTIEIHKLDSVPAGYTQGFIALGQAYELLPEGTTFDPANPATLTVHYDTSRLAVQSLDPESMAVAYLDTKSGSFVGVPNSVDASSGTVRAQLQHFTIYIPMAQNYATANVTPPSILLSGTMPANAMAGAPVYVMARVTTPYAGSGGSITKVQIRYTMEGDSFDSGWVNMESVQLPSPMYAGSYYENYYGYLIDASKWHSDPCAAGMVSAVNPEIHVQFRAVDNATRITNSPTYDIEANRVLVPGTSSIQSSGTGTVIAAGYSRTMRVRANYTNGCGGATTGPAQVVIEPSRIHITPSVGSSGSSGAEAYPALGTFVLTPTVVPASGSNSMLVSVSDVEPLLPYNFNVIPGSLKSIQVLDTNGAVPTGPIVVDGRSEYALDVRGLDEFGNSIPILPTSWSVDDAGSSVAGDGLVTLSNNPVIATVIATYDPFGSDPDAPTSSVQLNIIPRYTVSVNVAGLVGSTTLALNGVTEATPVASDGAYMLTGYVGDLTTATVSAVAQPFMGACHGDSQLVNGSDVAIDVQCYQLMGNSVISSTPLALGSPIRQVDLAGGTAGYQDGFGNNARFRNPYQITTDGKNLYVADSNNHRIRKIVIATGETTTVAGSGVAGLLDGVGTEAQLSLPRGITTDGTYLYLADNHTIKKIHLLTRQVTTIAGDSTTGANDDANGLLARFNQPTEMTTDGMNLFVTDYNNHVIRRVNITSGAVSSLAGSFGNPGLVDGTGAIARFNHPLGITMDGTHLYLTDYTNARIRRVTIADGSTITYTFTLSYPEAITYIGGHVYVTFGASPSDLYRIDVSTGVGQNILPNMAALPHGASSDGIHLFLDDFSSGYFRQLY